MKKITILLFTVTTSLLLLNCKSENKKQDFSTLTKNYFNDKNELDPLAATQNGQNEFNDKLQFEMTDSYRKLQTAFFDKYQTALQGIAIEDLKEEEKNSYEIIKWEIEIGKELLNQPTNLIPLHQFGGTHLTMGQFAGGTSAQPFKTEKDYTNFIERMDKYAVWIDSAMVYMKKGIDKGVVLPRALTLKLIPQFSEMATPKLEDNLFYSSIKLMPVSFPEGIKEDLTKKYTETINTKLIPRYKKMADFLTKEYLPASRKTSGIGSLTFGKDLYKIYVKQWTTTEMTPEEIHELGLKEVARLNAEMEKVKAQVGFKGSLIEFFEEVRNKKELKPFTTPEQVIANFQSIHNRIKPNVNKLFSLQPKTKFEIRRTEAFREKTASAEYNQGTSDGSRPGIFYVPIPDVKNYNTYGDEDLFLHEAIPGHHYQVSLQQENMSLPKFMRVGWFGAYGEGWAHYCETLGSEFGLYTDPYQKMGYLSDQMLRAVRLVVDTGLHTGKMTREEAIDYFLKNISYDKEAATAEIERYMAMPGQALSYKIGSLKMRELRNQYQKQLGNRFNLAKFHDEILNQGGLPLDVLSRKMENWAKKQ